MKTESGAISIEIDVSSKWAIFYLENARRDVTLSLSSCSTNNTDLPFLNNSFKGTL